MVCFDVCLYLVGCLLFFLCFDDILNDIIKMIGELLVIYKSIFKVFKFSVIIEIFEYLFICCL